MLIFQCLQRADPHTMVNTEWEPTGGAIALGICAMPFVPIVDGKFLLKDNPERILQSGELRKTPVLLGANREEGTYFLIYFLTHLFKLQHNVSTGLSSCWWSGRQDQVSVKNSIYNCQTFCRNLPPKSVVI